MRWITAKWREGEAFGQATQLVGQVGKTLRLQ